ncbi:MAG: carboxylesterase family protein, partial [Caulobacteraceae bacterium]
APRSASPLTGASSGSSFVVAETSYGKVLGQANGPINEFKGVPYGAPTGGRNRFMPPGKPTPWVGVRECLAFGPINPQTLPDLRSDYAMMIMWDRHVGGMGEDQLHLNIWTPGLRDGAKRPVFVSFHGGGFETGSGNAPGFDGAQLARFGDAVVVTVNHRLSSFGYIDLVSLGAPNDFAYAGVAGVMDMVASLEWVRDNIEAFGGDPSRVMIFGQSGGGAKTSVLLGCPAAKGLFSRAAVQSGSLLKLVDRETAAKSTVALLDKLGIPRSRPADLQKVPWTAMLEAQAAVASAAPGGRFAPVLDGHYLPHHPFDPAAPEESADVPLIVSTALEDAALSLINFDLDEPGLKQVLAHRFGGQADEITALYRARYPNKAAFLVQAQAFTDAGFRRAAIAQAELKARQGRGKVWMYQWDWATPAFDSKFGAVHGIDVSASFHNYRDQTVGSGVAAGRRMCKRLASAWVAFAHTGDPNNSEIPAWPTYDPQRRATMLFNDEMRAEDDPRGELRRYWAGHPPVAA